MAFSHKNLGHFQFPRYLHKEGEGEQRAETAHDAVQLIEQGWTLRPGEPVEGYEPPAADDKKKPAKK